MLTMTSESRDDCDWEKIGPVLDAAMYQLSDFDRLGIILRFFLNRSLREVGAELDVTEHTARKRTDLALKRLHALLQLQEATSTTVDTLAIALRTHAAKAPPPGCAAYVIGSVRAKPR